jgi:hypothetical protein
MTATAGRGANILLAQEVAEVGDGLLGLPHEEGLGLLAVVLIAVDV